MPSCREHGAPMLSIWGYQVMGKGCSLTAVVVYPGRWKNAFLQDMWGSWQRGWRIMTLFPIIWVG